MPLPETAVRDLASNDDLLTNIQDQLRKRSYLYESPHDYRAGVDAVVTAVLREVTRVDLSDATR
ncbi:MAG: hypothetical protein U0U69_08295 [Acidimicrobiia bacterium]